MIRQGKTLIVGLGNWQRGDDGAGLFVARQLARIGSQPAKIAELDGNPLRLLDVLHGYDEVVVVDAMISGARPGTTRCFNAIEISSSANLFSRLSSHGICLPKVIEIARTLSLLPEKFVVYGIEGKVFGDQIGLSPEVEQAATALARSLADMLQNPGTLTTAVPLPMNGAGIVSKADEARQIAPERHPEA